MAQSMLEIVFELKPRCTLFKRSPPQEFARVMSVAFVERPEVFHDTGNLFAADRHALAHHAGGTAASSKGSVELLIPAAATQA